MVKQAAVLAIAAAAMPRSAGVAAEHITSVAALLQEHLGRALVAALTLTHEQTVSRWSSGKSLPSEVHEVALRCAHVIFLLFEARGVGIAAHSWFQAANPDLGRKTPVALIAAGRGKRVIKAARAFIATLGEPTPKQLAALTITRVHVL